MNIFRITYRVSTGNGTVVQEGVRYALSLNQVNATEQIKERVKNMYFPAWIKERFDKDFSVTKVELVHPSNLVEKMNKIIESKIITV